MGQSLDPTAQLVCPHMGQVLIATADSRLRTAGGGVVLVGDALTITGCPFTIGPKASPCVRVQWLVPDQHVKVGGTPTLSTTAAGVCMSADGTPQGPVAVLSAQARVTTR
jgi:hypothetical protein